MTRTLSSAVHLNMVDSVYCFERMVTSTSSLPRQPVMAAQELTSFSRWPKYRQPPPPTKSYRSLAFSNPDQRKPLLLKNHLNITQYQYLIQWCCSCFLPTSRKLVKKWGHPSLALYRKVYVELKFVSRAKLYDFADSAKDK